MSKEELIFSARKSIVDLGVVLLAWVEKRSIEEIKVDIAAHKLSERYIQGRITQAEAVMTARSLDERGWFRPLSVVERFHQVNHESALNSAPPQV